MSGRPQEQRDQAALEPLRTPLDFGQGRLLYTRQMRRRYRRYRLVAALLVLGVVTGLVVVLLTDWLRFIK